MGKNLIWRVKKIPRIARRVRSKFFGLNGFLSLWHQPRRLNAAEP